MATDQHAHGSSAAWGLNFKGSILGTPLGTPAKTGMGQGVAPLSGEAGWVPKSGIASNCRCRSGKCTKIVLLCGRLGSIPESPRQARHCKERPKAGTTVSLPR